MDESQTVRSVFGQPIDLSEIAGLDVQEIREIIPSVLAVENGEPGYVYAWLVANDPQTGFKLRKGMYELVDAKTDPVICAGALRQDDSYRVNELVLVRARESDYNRVKQAAVARAARREMTASEVYKRAIKTISGQFETEPTYEKSEDVEVAGTATK